MSGSSYKTMRSSNRFSTATALNWATGLTEIKKHGLDPNNKKMFPVRNNFKEHPFAMTVGTAASTFLFTIYPFLSGMALSLPLGTASPAGSLATAAGGLVGVSVGLLFVCASLAAPRTEALDAIRQYERKRRRSVSKRLHRAKTKAR